MREIKRNATHPMRSGTMQRVVHANRFQAFDGRFLGTAARCGVVAQTLPFLIGHDLLCYNFQKLAKKRMRSHIVAIAGNLSPRQLFGAAGCHGAAGCLGTQESRATGCGKHRGKVVSSERKGFR
jgi:hypothetical protein